MLSQQEINEFILYRFELTSVNYKNMFEKMADLEMINKFNEHNYYNKPYKIGI